MDLKEIRNTTGYFFLAIFAIFIGLYPLRFIGLPYENSLLGDKPAALLGTPLYLTAFYIHIFLGGLSLLAGFTQFFRRIRLRWVAVHKVLGKIYIIAVCLSGFAGLAIAFFASGGIVAATGFACLAILWLYTTLRAYIAIRDHKIRSHQHWMIRSYALCFAAVTLRIYLPTMVTVLGIDFVFAYRLVAWLCWIPNLVVSELLIIRGLLKE
jgi:uncharacterized membrane protein